MENCLRLLEEFKAWEGASLACINECQQSTKRRRILWEHRCKLCVQKLMELEPRCIDSIQNSLIDTTPPRALTTDVWTAFYDELKDLRNYYKKFGSTLGNTPTTVMDAASMTAQIVEECPNLGTIFPRPEEMRGRVLDLTEPFHLFLNWTSYKKYRERLHRQSAIARLKKAKFEQLKKKAHKTEGESVTFERSEDVEIDENNPDVKRRLAFTEADYSKFVKQYVGGIDDVPRHCKYGDPNFLAYITCLGEYLESFHRRCHPLAALNKYFFELDQQFESLWEKKLLKNWFPKTFDLPNLYCPYTDKLFGSTQAAEGHLQSKKYLAAKRKKEAGAQKRVDFNEIKGEQKAEAQKVDTKLSGMKGEQTIEPHPVAAKLNETEQKAENQEDAELSGIKGEQEVTNDIDAVVDLKQDDESQHLGCHPAGIDISVDLKEDCKASAEEVGNPSTVSDDLSTPIDPLVEIREKSAKQDKQLALLEYRVVRLLDLLSAALEATLQNLRKKQSRTLQEITDAQGELEQDEGEDYVPEDSSSDESDAFDINTTRIKNPLNLPVGWDGKPIPYWLYRLHGLSHSYTCEICGNQKYWGKKVFENHFREWRHAFGMRCLKIPNTMHFKEITKIEDALNLYERLRNDTEGKAFMPDQEVEVEDLQGNVMTPQTYDDLRKQGLL